MKIVKVYSLLRNSINRKLKKSKKQHYIEYFDEHVNNIKKLGMVLKKIVNVKKTLKKVSQLTIGGKVIDETKC